MTEDSACAYFNAGSTCPSEKESIYKLGFLTCKIKDYIKEILAYFELAVPIPKVLTPTASVLSVSGSIAAGAHSLLLEFSSNFLGTVLGVAVDGSVTFSKSIVANAYNNIAAVTFTITAGTITVTRLD